jgi:hypothetical protein
VPAPRPARKNSLRFIRPLIAQDERSHRERAAAGPPYDLPP